MAQWWREVVGKEPTFWVADKNRLDAPFRRFLEVVIFALPTKVRPTKSRGSEGFQRNAAKKRYKKAKHEDERWEDTLRRFAETDQAKQDELKAGWNRAMEAGAQRIRERDKVRMREALCYLGELEKYATTQRTIVQEYLTKLEAEASERSPSN